MGGSVVQVPGTIESNLLRVTRKISHLAWFSNLDRNSNVCFHECMVVGELTHARNTRLC